jgi:transcriptional regulator with XRE-family HTH domain
VAESFGELLKRYREEAGLSQRELARRTEINPAIISRMESGDRGPSGSEQVLAIVRTLGLDSARADLLLASAGFWPEAIVALGPGDETLLAVARILSDPGVAERARRRFRRVIELLVEQWQAGGNGDQG